MATHSSILAWRFPCREEPSGLQSMGSQSPGDLPDPGMEHGSPALQVKFSPIELPGKPRLRESGKLITTTRGNIIDIER